MSFAGYKALIEEGDTVLLYISFNTVHPVRVTRTRTTRAGDEVENVHQTNYGALKVKELIGKKFGTKVRLSRGYAFALHPTPELWTKCLPHRTQILYSTDISMILLQLELRPGSVVVESGTGSGSLTHSLARTVSPGGRVHTFDFHEQRAQTAQEEFRFHGLEGVVTAAHGDACSEEGFGAALDGRADAVFLDLPHPWDAIGNAKRALKKSGGARICSFSPCIEQVQKATEKMKEEGFKELETMEVLLREFQVRRVTLPKYEPNRESMEIVQAKKRKLEENANGDAEEKTNAKAKEEEITFLSGLPLFQMPGHTGFLTFATLPASTK